MTFLESKFSENLVYRQDITGLRALAVLAVVLFHLDKSMLPAGFLGVDVFFVLSGYLITNIVVREIVSNRFTFRGFYIRRVRRLLPALAFMFLVVSVFAFFILLPSDLVGYSKSLLSSIYFVSNIYFWRDTNYFAAAAETKPLLHMWSLSVEEQFYLIFPLFLLLLIRYAKNKILWIIIFTVVVSYLLNCYLISIGGRSTAFYLLPSRAWQMSCGALLVFLPVRLESTKVSNACSVLGLLLIFVSVTSSVNDLLSALPDSTLVVIGTLLVIYGSEENQTVVSYILSRRPFVSIGEVSYSLYIWHWPIVVLWQYYNVDNLNSAQMFWAFCLMLFLAYFSTFFIEKPFRTKKVSNLLAKRALIIAFSLLTVFALVLIIFKGVPGRLSREAALINEAVGTNFRCPITKTIKWEDYRACTLNLPSGDSESAEVILLGNSHVQMYAPIWENILKQDKRTGVVVPQNGCLPTYTVNINVGCAIKAEKILKNILLNPSVELVVIGFNWDLTGRKLVSLQGAELTGSFQSILKPALTEMVSMIRNAGKKVILIGPLALPNRNVASEVSRRIAFGHNVDGLDHILRSEFIKKMGELLEEFDNNNDIGFVSVDNIQCDILKCYFIRYGKSYFADSNHLGATELDHFSIPMREAYLKQK